MRKLNGLEAGKPKRAVKIVSDPKMASLLLDPTRRQILSHLAEQSMTGAQLARSLKLTPPTVNFHLKILEREGMIMVVRTEPESHGIPQKFYGTDTVWFLIDYNNMPADIRRMYWNIHLERLRGVFATLKILHSFDHTLSSSMMEELAELMATTIIDVAREYEDKQTDKNRETLVIDIYSQALMRAMERGGPTVEILREAILNVQR